MQLHACLLLFIITTDKTLASSRHRCGGNVSLDQEPAGHINLTLPRLFTDTDGLNGTPPVSVCNWVIGLPAGRTVLLKLVRLESGSSASVRCFRSEAGRVLESERTALLSGCDGNKAALSWTGAGHSSDSIQLVYYVQEDQRNSSDDRTSPHSGRDLALRTQTGTSFASAAPVGQELVRGAEGGRGLLSGGLEELSSERQSVSSPSSLDRGLLHHTSPVQRLAAVGKTDRGTLPFPEEEPNNRADTSGAAHLTDGPISASERTHPYFQHTFSTDTLFHTSQSMQTETDSSNKLPPTQKPHATASSFNTMRVTDIQTSKLSVTTQEYTTVSSTAVQNLTSSQSELPSWIAWESETTANPQGGPVSRAPGEKLSHSWWSQPSTHRLNSELTSAVTSDPLKSPSQPREDDSSVTRTDTEPAASSTSLKGPGRAYSSTASVTSLDAAAGTVEAASLHPIISQKDPFASTASDVTRQTSALGSSDEFENTEALQIFTFSPQTQSDSPQSAEGSAQSTFSYTSTSKVETQETATRSTQRNLVDTYMTTNTVSSSSGITKVEDQTLTGPSSTPTAALTLGDAVQNSAARRSTVSTESHTSQPANTLLPDRSPSPVPHLSTSASIRSSTPSHAPQTRSTFSDRPHFSHTLSSLPSATAEPATHLSIERETTPIPSQTTSTIKSSHAHQTQNIPLVPSSSTVQATQKNPHSSAAATQSPLYSHTTAMSDSGLQEVNVDKEDESWFPSSTTAGPLWQPPPWTTPHPSQESHTTPTSSILTSMPTWSSTTSQTPKFYIVPDQPAANRVESIELLLQIIVEETRSAFASGLEEDTTAWVEPYLQRAPGFSRLLGVWSSGHAVQSLVEFKTSGALQWLSRTGPASLLERSGLAQAVREGRSFRSSKVTNVTLGGLQADVCDWLLQCQAGYKCVSQPGTSNYSCSSVCHFDFCHHHGICTHHPGQLPVCRCLVGEDFWFMGQRCDMKMTRARLVGVCLAILLIMVMVIAVLAFVVVRRYRAILIQAKVDQTRSSYRRFNHFDELSGRFWLRSWAGSADSLDNPAFTRSDELLHLRALDRPCCYHDDTLSLASTCPSHGARINTIYPHSSQYGWRGSEMSIGDGVLDSGKASDLSVCSWPVEPIQWTPFPILQQLASHRTPTMRVSRPRSYCEGMELVDLGKSWTA